NALSRALLSYTDDQIIPSTDLILTQFTDRGLLRGELGTTFFLPMPGDGSRLLAIAGLGQVGRCGPPELSVLVRELCWALGRYRKMHLATVLIGSGNGNLSVRQCVEAWIRGVKRAIDDDQLENIPRTDGDSGDRKVKRALDDARRENRATRLRCITFVEYDPLKVVEIQAAIEDVRRLLAHEIKVRFEPLSDERLTQLEQMGLDQQCERLERQLQTRRDEIERWHKQQDESKPRHAQQSDDSTTKLAPTRLTASMQVDPKDPNRVRYRFGALTDTASIPEREVTLNRVIVKNANDELAGETDVPRQSERGEFLGRLLIPGELTRHLSSTAPLVLQLDATSARIHWEMIAQPDPILPEGDRSGAADLAAFLGTYRGLTRQLRTTFARPPEPSHNRQSVLRVLVVADPARDNTLPGAEEEGLAVAELFESFNTLADRERWPQRFQVTRLIGSFEATPTAVLRELAVRRYDVLHYAGHCFFDPQEPERSGWIFSDGVVISAYELQRIDRVPPLVFANACESGITPDRTGERSAAMVPSFAEAFFAQGVANYVGTAWPVDDIAARRFATILYGALLGLDVGPLGESPAEIGTNSISLMPQPMHQAILRARVAIARTPGGRGTWGAYQHYGNPYYRLLSNPPSRPSS
ncbi:MAG: CHAT domain-containing protein, partial [Isosphaeraceae bacterium]